MPDEPPPSLQNNPARQPVNPYEASAEARGVSPDAPSASTERHYQARITWADRRMLLRSVLPARLTAITSGVLTSFHFLSLVQTFFTYGVWIWVPVDLVSFVGVLVWFCFAVGIAASFVSAAMLWRYSDQLQSFASGRSSSLTNWTVTHHRYLWAFALSFGLGVLQSFLDWVWTYLETHYMDAFSSGP